MTKKIRKFERKNRLLLGQHYNVIRERSFPISRRKLKMKDISIVGIDQSLNGLAACKIVNNKVVNFLFITSIKKLEKHPSGIYYKMDKKLDKDISEIDRMLFIETLLHDIIWEWLPHYVAFEGYAYGASKGNQLQIGELGGVLRKILYVNYIPFRVYDPTTVKLFATGKGNAEKKEVTKCIEKRFNMDLSSIASYDKNKNRKWGEGSDGDVADSISMAAMLNLELKIRKGIKSIKDVSENERRIFNRTTKRNPENLLFRDFLLKDSPWWERGGMHMVGRTNIITHKSLIGENK